MERVQRAIELLYDQKLRDNFDRIMPVIGDEGVGKSTFILECIARYEVYRGNEPAADDILEYVVFDSRTDFAEALRDGDVRDPIAVMDAAHVLYRKDTMTTEQKDTERSLLDIRIQNYPVWLGYQDWGDIPDMLQRRRARTVWRIPRRGVVHGYNRDSLDEIYRDPPEGDSDWPEPDLVDTFPDLSKTELWERFQELDKQRKLSRLDVDDEEEGSGKSVSPQEAVDSILDGEPENYVDVNSTNGQAFISKSLIQFDFPELSDREVDQVKAAIRRETSLPEKLSEVAEA